MLTFLVSEGFDYILHLFTLGFLELNRLGQIGNFSSGIGKKSYFLALGMGPNFGPKFRGSRALVYCGICFNNYLLP